MTERSEILIAVDGSREGNAALRLGVELAVARQAGVTLLHVNPSTAATAYDEDPLREPSDKRITDLDPVLRDAKDFASSHGVAVHLKLVGGPDEDASTDDVLAAIEGVATSRNADLIVVGSRGHGALASAFLGSVSHELLKESDRPVLVIRDPLAG